MSLLYGQGWQILKVNYYFVMQSIHIALVDASHDCAYTRNLLHRVDLDLTTVFVATTGQIIVDGVLRYLYRTGTFIENSCSNVSVDNEEVAEYQHEDYDSV